MSIITKDNKTGREIETPEPKCLNQENLSDLVALVGEDLVKKYAEDQILVKFRAHIRGKLNSVDEGGEEKYSDEEILAEDYSEWTPELRTRMTAEERAMKALADLPPDVAAAVLANYNKA